MFYNLELWDFLTQTSTTHEDFPKGIGRTVLASLLTAIAAIPSRYFLAVVLLLAFAYDLYANSVLQRHIVSEESDLTEPGRSPLYKQHSPWKSRKNIHRTLTFHSEEMDAQLQQIITRFTPRPKDLQAVKGLAKAIDDIISSELKIHATVRGFVCVRPLIASPLVKLEPEISIVVTVDLVKYHAWLKEHVHTQVDCTLKSSSKNVLRRVKKSLLGKHDFKSRRLIFGSESARLILDAPIQQSSCRKRACMQLVINDPVPSRVAKLKQFCGKFQPLASDLMLIVLQWVRWRAICLVDKGDMPLYAWNLLVIFFVQSRGLLPPYGENTKDFSKCATPEKTSAMLTHLFKGFLCFYNNEFDFDTEVVSVTKGKRSCRQHPSNTALCIEDPFDGGQDPCGLMMEHRVNLLKQEFQRGDCLCSSSSEFSHLFECRRDVHA